MASVDINVKLRHAVSMNNEDEVKMILVTDNKDIDLLRINGDDGNMINVAIEKADVHVLAQLLGVQFPEKECVIALSDSKRPLLISVCDSKGMTPLMKAVQLGKVQMVSLLLSCGAEVNDLTRDDMAPIDISHDPEIVCVLFKHDSKFPLDEKKSSELRFLVSTDDSLRDLFRARDEMHDSIKRGEINDDIKKAFERGKWVYYVDSLGHSLLYTACKNCKFYAWAYFMDQDMKYATLGELEDDKNIRKLHEEMCERGLGTRLFPIEGCHLMKLVSKSVVYGSYSHRKDLICTVFEYFQFLDKNEITKTLMQVVQDVPGLQIAFDFSRLSIERMRASCSKQTRGITDFNRCKICVAAEESSSIGFPEIVSNLAHEICHFALSVVFKNNGLPYTKVDKVTERLYANVKDEVLDSDGCDDMICKVKRNYEENQHGRELIVRVAEMVAKYQASKPDGFSRLNNGAKALLDFYLLKVQPKLREYIDGIFTSNRIIGRGLMEYQKLLSQVDWVKVTDGIDKDVMNFINEHNHLLVLKTSNVKLAQSHLNSSFKKNGPSIFTPSSLKPPLFVDWSIFQKWPELFINGLKLVEIETLAISWDDEAPPPFCNQSDCRNFSCPGNKFRGLTGCVVFLVRSERQVPEGEKFLEYFWDDLSQETKRRIQEWIVRFGGTLVELENIISGSGEVDDIENFMRELLDSSDLNLLLEEGDIIIGKENSLLDSREGNIVFKHPRKFISRKLSQRYVEFNEDMIRKFSNDVFLVSDIEITDLCDLGISEVHIRQWDGNICDGPAHCYVLHPMHDDKNDEPVIQEILEQLRGFDKINKFHHLKFRQGMFAHIKSVNILMDTDTIGDKVEGIISSFTVERLLETSVFKGTDTLLIADDPGTGKTNYLHSLANEIKKYNPEKWVSIIDLSLLGHQNHLMTSVNPSFSGEEILELLFQLIGNGNCSLEAKVFHEYCNRENKIIIIFDGFDEICPNYKSIATSFIVGLKRFNGNIKVFVSTRLHEKCDLEEALRVISYQLIPFNEDDQVNFLDGYWNELLNSLSLSEWQEKIESFIDNFERCVVDGRNEVLSNLIPRMKKMLSISRKKQELSRTRFDFKPVAMRVVFGQEPLLNGLGRLTETPLHVQILAALLFEDSFNFNRTMNLGHLYQRFYDLEIKIYGWRKADIYGNVRSEDFVKIGLQKITATLEKLSVNLLQEEISYKITNDERRIACNTGFVNLKEEKYQFIHRTFAEFFFARRMLKKAGTTNVTKLWLDSLFLNDHFSKVRMFLEDILHILSEELVDFKRAEDILMLKKTNLKPLVIGDSSGLRGMTTTVYALIHHISVHALQYFADSLGKSVVEVLIQDFDCIGCHVPCSVKNAIKLYNLRNCFRGFESERKFWNAFTYAAYLVSLETEKPPCKYIKVVKKILVLVEEHGMLTEMNNLLLKRGFEWLLPNYFLGSHVSVVYTAEVINFLLENKETFGDVLMRRISSTPERNDELVEVFTLNFDILPSVMRVLYDETQRACSLAKEGLISRVWINTVKTYGLDNIREVWDFIEGSLREDLTQLRNYLLWKDKDGFNALVHSAYNEDPKVIEFIWELAGKLIDVHEKKQWLHQSFDCGDLNMTGKCLEWGFHKFLRRLVNGGYLSGDEMFNLLMSKDVSETFNILTNYPYGLFTHVLPIDHRVPRNTFVKTMRSIDLFYLDSWLYCYSSHSLNEDLKGVVDSIFEEVRSRDRYCLADQLELDDNGFLVGEYSRHRNMMCRDMIHQDKFKYFVAVIFKQVEFFRDQFQRDDLLSYLRFSTESLVKAVGPNIFHLVVNSMTALCLGYVSSVLIGFLSPDDFLTLLFEPDKLGNTVFHLSALRKYRGLWGKLYDITRALLGENALSEIHFRRNSKGLCVHHLFLQKMNRRNEGVSPE